MTSQRVERTWIRTDGYRRFRGERICEVTNRHKTTSRTTKIYNNDDDDDDDDDDDGDDDDDSDTL